MIPFVLMRFTPSRFYSTVEIKDDASLCFHVHVHITCLTPVIPVPVRRTA